MTKKLLPIVLVVGSCFCLNAQTIEELKAQKAEKEAQIAALTGEVNSLSGQIEKLAGPAGWQFGSLGTIGLNFSKFDNWISTETPNTFSSTLGISGSAFANLDEEKFFWRNSGAINIAKTKLDTDTEDNVDADYETSADAFGVSSLYGRKLSEKLAISALGEYRTTLLSNFNNPGYLDLGTGATWTPIKNMVVVFHPLNYNFVFSEQALTYNSSLGCKIVADYSRVLSKGIAWKTNFSTFISYKDLKNFSNWIWVNGFSLNVWKALGVGFELGLKNNRQEGYNYKLAKDNLSPDDFNIDDLNSSDNPIQTYWLFGITYKL
jgi:hypothetical protein